LLRRLYRLGTARDGPRYVVILADREVSPEEEAYVEMLSKAGSFAGAVISMVDFKVIPEGLTAIEIDRFVRENGTTRSGSVERRESGRLTPSIQVELE